MTKPQINSICGLILMFFLGVILVISKDPYSDPGFSIFMFGACLFGTSFFLGKLLFGSVFLSSLLGLYSIVILILLFLKLLTIGTLISSAILFLLIGFIYRSYLEALNEKNIKSASDQDE